MAYDLKSLVEKFKAKGLDLAEEAAQLVVDSVFEWIPEEAAKTDTKVDDFVAGLLPMAKPVVDKAVDRIDGEVG